MATKRQKTKTLKTEPPDAGAFQRLTDFVRRIVAVPKAEADAEADAYHRSKRKPDHSVSKSSS